MLVPGRVEYCIFDRSFNNSTGEYARFKCNDASALDEVQRNRAAVASIYEKDDIVTLQQVHGSDLLSAEKAHAASKEIGADGMLTAEQNLVLAIQTADCVPVLLASDDGQAVAALHCGWRSSRAGIIDKAIDKFQKTYDVTASQLSAVVGPAIKQESYEVDLAFYNDFLEESSTNMEYFQESKQQDKFLFDLPSYVINKLRQKGAKIHEHINEDTYANSNKYPSRRRSFHKNEKYRGSILSTIAIIG